MKRISLLTLLVFFSISFSQKKPDDYQKMRQAFTYFGNVYQKVTDNFVEDIDPLILIKSGIHGMLSGLDPYTEFFDESNSHRLNLITSGTYGGIGIEIAERPSGIMVMNVLENSPAYREQVRSGDYITHINHQSIISKKLSEVSSLLKGSIGEEIILKVKNSISCEERTVLLAREEIHLFDVPYSGFIAKNTGYIKLAGFSEYAPKEVKSAINKLKHESNLNSLVIDLRDNPGGLLESARQIVNLFVPRGELILSTFGKKEGITRVYATEHPQYPDLPLVILINRNSASASEIIAGAFQDLDRAVIIGEQSYGKGLVQKIYTIDPKNNIKVKITTAKYFTPSGRCIQKYPILESDPTVNIKTFYTRNGREVKSGSGITPDIRITFNKETEMLKQLRIQHVLMDFSLDHIYSHKEKNPTFSEFKQFLNKSSFSFKPEGVKEISTLQLIADKNNYSEKFQSSLNKILVQLTKSNDKIIEKNQDKIIQEIVILKEKLIHGTKGFFTERLKHDFIIKESLKLFSNTKDYKEIIHRN